MKKKDSHSNVDDEVCNSYFDNWKQDNLCDIPDIPISRDEFANMWADRADYLYDKLKEAFTAGFYKGVCKI